MDTISRESSPSYLPIAGLFAGLLGLLLGGIALANASKANKAVVATADSVTTLGTRVDGIEGTISNATSTAERASTNVASLQRSTQDAFTAVAGEMGKLNGEVAKLQEAVSKPVAVAAAKPGSKVPGASAAPAVAGPDEYVIEKLDTGAKIARAKGIPLGDLVAVNPGVNWSSLKVGQKIKLPAKK